MSRIGSSDGSALPPRFACILKETGKNNNHPDAFTGVVITFYGT